MEVVEKDAKGTADAFTSLSSLETEDEDWETVHVEAAYGDSEATSGEAADGDSEATSGEAADGDSEATSGEAADGDSEVKSVEAADDESETIHVQGENETIRVVSDDASTSSASDTTIHASTSSDEDTLAEMEAAGWLRMIKDMHFARDRAIDAIADMSAKRSKFLKPEFEMTSKYCRDECEPGFDLIIGSLNEAVQIEFEVNSKALQNIVNRFDAKALEIKLLINRRIKNTYKVLTVEKMIEDPPQDVKNCDGTMAYVSICIVILCFVIMSVYPNFYDDSFNYFFPKLLILTAIFVFTTIFYYCIGKHEKSS